jgi:hypothetical protein
LGSVLIWFQGKKSYDKGIKDAVLMHREGRLVYKDYTDENGTLMVDIQILPIDEY